ncbi:MAG: hypothetical protein QM704_12975 [Anaeromyxobacteraceae bacterium]
MRIDRLVALLAAAALAPAVRAGDVQVTSSTQYLRYADFLSDKTDQQDVAEYLRLSATFGDQKNVTVAGYGRIVGTLTTSFESDSRNELANDVTGRLYYLYLDYRDAVPGLVDLRAGRTFVGTNALPAVVDGGQLRLKNAGVKGLSLTGFGGRRVWFDNKSELPYDGDWIWGAGAAFDTVAMTHVEASYGREYHASEVARDEVALDVETTPFAYVSVFGRGKVDLVTSKANELSLGAKVAPLAGLVLRAELYQSRPTFERSSFYRYFEVENYQQASLAAEYRVLPWLRLDASYAYERFDKDESANVYEAGVKAKPLANLFVNASYEGRQGYAGKLGGLRASAGYTFWKATVLAGADYDDFKRQASRDGSSKKFWAGADVEITKTVRGVLRLERDTNYLYDAAYQGFVAVDVHL